MNKRISQVRKDNNLNQQEFADRIGLTKNYVSLMETGARNPSDRTISDICREFNVDRTWLETGVGEPFVPKTRQEELKSVFADVLSGRPSEKNAFIEAVSQLPEEVFTVLVQSWIQSAERMKEILNKVEKE